VPVAAGGARPAELTANVSRVSLMLTRDPATLMAIEPRDGWHVVPSSRLSPVQMKITKSAKSATPIRPGPRETPPVLRLRPRTSVALNLSVRFLDRDRTTLGHEPS